ncbi:MAG: MarR family winged helix-turn-helix transcriptional regulator [Nitriliruptorales bacterium]
MEAWKALLETQRALLDRLGDELRDEHGLPLNWYDVLVQLGRAPGRRLRMNELAAAVLLTPSGLTRLVDRLERADLVRRERCPTDRRAAEVVLTDEGRERLRGASPTHLRGIERHFAQHLSDDEAETLRSAFRKILRALQEEA